VAKRLCYDETWHEGMPWDGKYHDHFQRPRFPIKVINFGNLAAFGAILAIFSLRMCISDKLAASGENFDTGIRFFDSDFLIGNDILTI